MKHLEGVLLIMYNAFLIGVSGCVYKYNGQVENSLDMLAKIKNSKSIGNALQVTNSKGEPILLFVDKIEGIKLEEVTSQIGD